MELAAFYGTASGVSFTLLGFWWVVVQARHAELAADPGRRLVAFLVSLHFILPGMMSLASMVLADVPGAWRVTVALPAVVGLGAVLVIARRVRRPRGVLALIARGQWVGVAIYGALILVAVLPDAVRAALGVPAVRAAGLLLIVQMLIGVLFAWAMFMERPADRLRDEDPSGTPRGAA